MQFITLDVFTGTPFLGNPLAVVIVEASERDALDKGRRQLVAREFNLSETAFLYLRPGETLQRPDRSSSAREVGIFTPERELPFAGHPTVGTTYLLLRHLGWDFIDTIVPPAGPIRIAKAGTEAAAAATTTEVGGAGGGVVASIPHDVHVHSRTLRCLLLHEGQGDAALAARVGAALHDDDDDDDDDEEVIRTAELDAPAVSIVKGMAFVLVELPSLEHLGRARAGGGRLDLPGGPSRLLDEGPWGAGSFLGRYYYVRQGVVAAAAAGEDDGRRREESIRARLAEVGFEDPATGSAASALASYLSLRGDVDEVRYRVTQGVEMGRKSDIEVDIVSGVGDEGQRVIKEVRLGGTATVVMKGEVQVPA